MTRRLIGLVALATLTTLCGPSTTFADMRGAGGRPFGPPSFMRHLYPPRLVMRNQEKIGLTDDQRRAITDAIEESRKSLGDLERTRATAAEALDAAVTVTPIDEPDALAKAAALITIEQEIKKAHLRLLVRVKNQLTPEQHATLDGLRDEMRSGGRQRRDRLGPVAPAPKPPR